jgi:hypothetical protein
MTPSTQHTHILAASAKNKQQTPEHKQQTPEHTAQLPNKGQFAVYSPCFIDFNLMLHVEIEISMPISIELHFHFQNPAWTRALLLRSSPFFFAFCFVLTPRFQHPNRKSKTITREITRAGIIPLLRVDILVVSSKPLQIAQRDFGVCFMCV